MNRSEIKTAITNVQHAFEHTNWIIGGSAALVIQEYIEEANDIDLIQHSGDRIFLDKTHEIRMWSHYYPELHLDCHFSNPRNLNGYAKCFHKIIRALEYIDTRYKYTLEGWNFVTPWGAGLINWLHHFLEYGYQPAKTISPQGTDKIALKKILGVSTYDTIQWKVDQEQIMNRHSSAEAFIDFAITRILSSMARIE